MAWVTYPGGKRSKIKARVAYPGGKHSRKKVRQCRMHQRVNAEK